MKEIELKKINDFLFKVEKTGPMKVPLFIYASEKLLNKIKEDGCIEQGMNVAALPGIINASYMLPDAHRGYGFSIGGVAAFDAETGVISPGGVGFDINCGVRFLSSNLVQEQVSGKIQELIDALYNSVPVGVGSESTLRLSNDELDRILNTGARWAVENNLGNEDDLEYCEEHGSIKSADSNKVSTKAKSRGRAQLGTLGAGNHFLEVQFVEEIYDEKIAKIFRIDKKSQVCVMIHCGSRGLGHQVCSDYLRKMEDAYPDIVSKLPEKDLIYAPASSELAQDYFKAMCAAANFAWANRHIIAHQVRKSFKMVFGADAELRTIYDVAHNIAKLEEYELDGVKKKVYVHRKGATRAFGPNRAELPKHYQKTGQPIIIPGSMGTSSYVLVGTDKAMSETFGSTAHGAGRVMSRNEAINTFRGEQIRTELAKKNIVLKAKSWKGVAEECPSAYKDIDEIVKVSNAAGIGKLIAKLRPMGVIKG